MELNKRFDLEVRNIIQSFEELLEVSRVGGKDRTTVAVEQMQIQNLASTIIRSVNEILSISTQLKESLLLGDLKTLLASAQNLLNNS